MRSRFLVAMVLAFMASILVLGGAGYSVTRVAVAPPPDVFRTIAFEFELAEGWWCELDGTEHICTPPGPKPHDAIVIMAMKERNAAMDSLQHYETHLKTPQIIGDASKGDAKASEIRYVKRSMFGPVEWVEALHTGSELPNYDTYYLATVTSHLGILVTMSVNSGRAEKSIGDLKAMMSTVNLYQR